MGRMRNLACMLILGSIVAVASGAQSTDDAPVAGAPQQPATSSTSTPARLQGPVTIPVVSTTTPAAAQSIGFREDVAALEARLEQIQRQRRQGWQANAKPWENETDFLYRLDIEEKQAIAALTGKLYTVTEPDVRLTVGAFDRDSKYWPITVESTDPNLTFKSEYRYSILASADRADSFTRFDAFQKAGFLVGLAEYRVLPKAANIYTLEVVSVKVINKSTGEVLAVDTNPKKAFTYHTRNIRPGVYPGALPLERGAMQLVAGGIFVMGSNSSAEDQRPQRQLTMAPFHISRHEVTVGEFRAFVEEWKYQTQAQKDGGGFVWTGREWRRDVAMTWLSPGFAQSEWDPVVVVSWNDAAAYCNWLSWREGLQQAYTETPSGFVLDPAKEGYRLPTEAQWEYAARGGAATRGTPYAGSADLRQAAWYYGNADTRTHPVGTLAPNELGIYDMSGNVWEWCQDWYGSYQAGERSDPTGSAGGTHRVIRGGSYASDEYACKTTFRGAFVPSLALPYLGFRVVRPAR